MQYILVAAYDVQALERVGINLCYAVVIFVLIISTRTCNKNTFLMI